MRNRTVADAADDVQRSVQNSPPSHGRRAVPHGTSAVQQGTRAVPLPLIVGITASGTLSLHIFLPALPALAADLNTTPAAAQLMLTLYLVGLAIGQLFYGSLSDRYGRRPLLIAGLALFLVATVAAWFAPGIQALLVARVFQALGGCSGQVLGRTILRDEGGDVLKRLAVLATAMAVFPAMAPFLGGYLTSWFGWRSIFALLAAMSVVLLAATLLLLPETNRNPLPPRGPRDMIGDLIDGFAALLRIPAYRGYTIGGALASTSVYAYMAAAPFLFVLVLKRPAQEVGFYILLLVASVTAGTLIAARLAARARGIAQAACAVQLAAAAVLLAIELGGWLSVPTLVLPMLVFGLGTGIAYPSTMALALSVDDRRIGTASSLFGFVQMSAGAVFTLLVGIWSGPGALPTATVLLVAAALALIAVRYGNRASRRSND